MQRIPFFHLGRLLLVFVMAWVGTSRLTAEPMDDLLAFEPGVRFEQGALIRGRLKVPGRVMVLDRLLPLGTNGEFVFGLGRDYPEILSVKVMPDGKAPVVFSKPVRQREYRIQRIEGVAQKYISPDEAALKRISRDAALINEIRTKVLDQLSFLEPFRWPAIGPITGVYGSQRVFNGEPRRPHFGVDIAAPKGTQVTAPASGEITLADPDMYYSGATVVLDHGFGVSSTFLHLDTISVKAGQRLKAGDPIGTVGASGRATGVHLDWRVNWFDQRLDPEYLVGPMPQP